MSRKVFLPILGTGYIKCVVTRAKKEIYVVDDFYLS